MNNINKFINVVKLHMQYAYVNLKYHSKDELNCQIRGGCVHITTHHCNLISVMHMAVWV